MKKFSVNRGQFAGLLIVLLFVATAMAGAIHVSTVPAAVPVASPSASTINGDVTVGTGYSLTTWTLSGGVQTMQGNLTVASGGTVTLSNETLMFDEFSAVNSLAGYESSPIYHIIVQDGGRLILYHSVITTNLQLINAIPVLGLLVQHNGTLSMSDHSSLMFPGQFVVSAANFTMTNSAVTGIPASTFNTNYINETAFPVGIFDNPPVVSFFGANAVMENSSMSIYENNTTGSQGNPVHVFTEHYPFAADTGSKNTVQYTLEGVPTAVNTGSPAADTTKHQSLSNLTAYDSTYYDVAAGQTLSVTDFTTSGISSPLQAASLNVAYKSTGSSTLFWAYGGSTAAVSSLNLAASSTPTNVSFALPASLTVNDLSRIVAWLSASSGTTYVNKLWVQFTFASGAYKNLTVDGSSSFTAIDSFIGANYSPSFAHHSSVVLDGTAHSYFYNVQIDESSGQSSTSMYSTAFFGENASMVAKPFAFGPANTPTASDSLSLLDSKTPSASYAIPANGVLQTYGMNVTTDPTLNTRLSSAMLSITSNASTGAVVEVGQIGKPLINTGVGLTKGAGAVYTINLYKLGFTTLADIQNMVIYIQNGGTITYLNNTFVQLGILSQAYIYRYANITVFSSQGLPVEGSSIAAYFSGSTPDNVAPGSLAGYFVGPDNLFQSVPPASVLSTLGKTSSNYEITNQLGNAMIPLLSDVIDATTTPDSLFTGNYTAVVSYNGSTYGNTISFTPYPVLTEQSQVVTFNITIAVTLPLPQINVGRPYVLPSFLYVNQSGTISFNVTDSGLTGVSSLPINVTDGANGAPVSYYQLNISLGAQSTTLVSVPWHFTAGGNNTISVFANKLKTVPESSYAGDTNSTVFYVEPNLPEFVIPSSGITFSPSTAYSGKAVTITAAVQNFLGRAGASNVTVAFYYGNPLTGGTYIGKSAINVSAGGSTTTAVSWTPNTIGQLPIYVYIDPQHAIQQYTTAGNLNFSVLTVLLSIGYQDIVVNNSNSNYASPFTIPAQLNVSSNVIVTQSGYLAIVNGGLNFIETYGGEYSFLVNQSGELLVQNSYINSNQLIDLYVYGNTRMFIENSLIGPNINIILGGNSRVWINSSVVEGTVSTAAFSSSVLRSYNSSFSNPLTFGYNEVARLYNVTTPYVAQQSSAAAYIYRWLYVTVYGPSGTTISGSTVTLDTFANITQPSGKVYAQLSTNSSGVALFAGLSDVMSSGQDTYTGNYIVNTSYKDVGTWYAPQLTVSLAHYTAPLLQVNSGVSAHLNIKLPDLVLTPADIVFDTSPVVEASHVTVEALVYNLGYGAVTQNFNVTFYLPGSSPVNVSSELVAPMQVNSTVPISVTWAVPMSYGNMTVAADVNLNRNVTEISYGNNFAQTVVDVLSLPHLSVLKMNATGTMQEFSNVTFNVVIGNTGQTGALNVPVVIVEGNSTKNATTVVANGTLASIGPETKALLSIVWTVPALPSSQTIEHLYFNAIVNPNDTILETSGTQSTLPQAILLNITRAQVNANVVVSSTSVKAGSFLTVTVTVTSRSNGKPMANYPLTITMYNIRGLPQPSQTFQTTTDQGGVARINVPVPSSESQGSYHFQVYSEGQFVSNSPSFNVINNSPTGIPFLYLLLIVLVAVGAFVAFSAYLYRYGLARVVECGNCGAFIPETSKKCPYCSVEFEPGTAKCSNCSSWIPAASKQCPICGVKFADEGESDQEDEMTLQLRKDYSSFTEKFKAQSKAEMGNKYTDKAFLSWWKKQPTYLTFEDWLSRQQEVKKAAIISCPVCGEPNPKSSRECLKCGSPLASEQPASRNDQQKPPEQPPAASQGKPAPQEPRRIVVPKRIIRKVEDRPQSQGQQPGNQQQEGGQSSGNNEQQDGDGAQ